MEYSISIDRGLDYVLRMIFNKVKRENEDTVKILEYFNYAKEEFTRITTNDPFRSEKRIILTMDEKLINILIEYIDMEIAMWSSWEKDNNQYLDDYITEYTEVYKQALVAKIPKADEYIKLDKGRIYELLDSIDHNAEIVFDYKQLRAALAGDDMLFVHVELSMEHHRYYTIVDEY